MTLEEMRKTWWTNGDGGGIAWMNQKTRRVEYIKGITEVTELYEYSKGLDLPHVLHFRLQSIGVVDPLLTHPFEISKDSPLKLHGDCERALMMNGTEHKFKFAMAAAGVKIPLEKDGKTESLCSDSRAIAIILSQHKNNDFLKAAEGKFVDIGYHHAKDENWIRYYGDFDEDDGILYSNLKWKWAQGYSYQKKGDDNDDWRGHSQFGNESPIGDIDKKKDKKKQVSQSLQIEDDKFTYKLKPYVIMDKKERWAYRKFWSLHAPYSSHVNAHHTNKYPLALPPNTVERQPVQHEIGVQNKVYDYEKERQEFMGGGSEGFNRGVYF